MLQLNLDLATATRPQEQIGLERKAEATAREIDLAVYSLFGLKPAEINVIEGEVAREAVSAWGRVTSGSSPAPQHVSSPHLLGHMAGVCSPRNSTERGIRRG